MPPDDWSFPATNPTRPLTPLSARNSVTGRVFATSASLVRARVRLAAPVCAAATVTGSRFLPVSERNQELVNSIARVVQPQAGRSETGPRI